MKKIIAIVMTAVMLLAMLVPASATTTSPVKKYEDAKPGELLYKINFNGDAAFTPGLTEASDEYTDYTISTDGSAVTIKSKQGAENKKFNLWGGLIKDLPATNETIYSMVYRAKANGASDNADTAKNNSVGVGGWAISETAFNTSEYGIYNVYSNHNTKQLVDGTAVNYSGQRTALSDGIKKLGNDEQPNTGYVKVSEVGATLAEEDGFVTVLLVFDGTKTIPTIANYYLKDGATDLTKQASWVKFDERPMVDALVPGSTEANYMCFWTYAHYNVIDTTIKNVEYYREYLWSDPNAPATGNNNSGSNSSATTTTEATTTEAPTTTEAATTAAATKKPADTTAKAEEKGCGGTITVAGLALVASLGTCAVYVEKKRRK